MELSHSKIKVDPAVEIYFSPPSERRKELKLSVEAQETLVERMYKEQLAKRQEHFKSLQDKYYPAPPSSKLKPKSANSLIDRLVPPREALMKKRTNNVPTSQETMVKRYDNREDPHLAMFWQRQRILYRKRLGSSIQSPRAVSTLVEQPAPEEVHMDDLTRKDESHEAEEVPEDIRPEKKTETRASVVSRHDSVTSSRSGRGRVVERKPSERKASTSDNETTDDPKSDAEPARAASPSASEASSHKSRRSSKSKSKSKSSSRSSSSSSANSYSSHTSND